MTKRIEIEELTRIEGHAGIVIELEGNKVKDVKFNIFEGPRFFESLIKTMRYEKIPDITRRICAICTASHSLASIGAIENAFNVKTTPQTQTLRDLLIHGESIESHALHVYMLALPDFLGFPDAFTMASKHLDAVKSALMLKKSGNLIHNVLSGREVHGMNERVGGFSKIPSEAQLLEIKEAMKMSLPIAELAVQLLSEVDTPKYSESDNVIQAIDCGHRFGYMGDHILTSEGSRVPEKEYEKMTNEKIIQHSYAKFSTLNGKPFMVGALPRLCLNGGKLEGKALELFKTHRDLIDPRNSVSNNLCQAIELVHDVERSIMDIDELLSNGLTNEDLVEFEPYVSRGVNAIEAPRGLLYHDYSFDEEGRITKANIITPTAQNAANIEKDVRVIAENLADREEAVIKQALEVMVRAYDPCVSCSVHLTKLK
jgi:sulfhydrogenase subunit alpha